MESFGAGQTKTKFIIYENIDGGWENVTLDKMRYICDVDIDPANKKAVKWHDKEYNDVEMLMTDVFAYNDTLDFPAWTYNHNLRPTITTMKRFGGTLPKS